MGAPLPRGSPPRPRPRTRQRRALFNQPLRALHPEPTHPNGPRLHQSCRHRQARELPPPTPHLWHPHARKRSRHPLHPAAAWPCPSRHHPDLHPSEHPETQRDPHRHPSSKAEMKPPKPPKPENIEPTAQTASAPRQKTTRARFTFNISCLF